MKKRDKRALRFGWIKGDVMVEKKVTEMSIAQQAIETARAVVNGNAMFAKIAAERGNTPERAANRMLDNLERELAEAMKTVAGKKRPAGDFLVVGNADKVSTWALPVKVNGKPDHRLMGAAKAALHGGYRGNKYEGPGKAEAIKKLKALYKAEDMEWSETAEAAMGETYYGDEPAPYIPMAVLSFADLQAAEQAEEATAQIRQMTYQFKELVSNIMFSNEVEDKAGALRTLTEEFAGLISDKIGDVEAAGNEDSEPDEAAESLTENVGASGLEDYDGDLAELGIDATIETGRRAPVLVEFQVLEPGPGNKRDNHYYPRDVLKRDAGVFGGVDMFATDHNESERNERTKVGRVRVCPVRFTESGAPVAEVIIYDPGQAEKARNRADAGELATLECSIFARGISEAGEVGGEQYKVVTQITEGKYLELVGKAGAGGHALSLAESETTGGDEMKDEKAAEDAPLEEDIEEGEPEAEDGEQQEPVEEAEARLEEAEVSALVEVARLPDSVKALLRLREYADEEELKAAIGEMTEVFKVASGSGKPAVTRGVAAQPPDRAATLAERDAAKDAVNSKWLKTRIREVKSND